MARNTRISNELIKRVSERIPPSNAEAEKAVLGIALVDNSVIPELVNLLRPEQFYYQDNRLIYRTILELFSDKQPVDLMTLSHALERRSRLEEAGGAEYIATLPDAAPVLGNFEHYAQIICEKYKLREIIRSLNEVLVHAYGDSASIDQIINLATQRLYDVREDQNTTGFEKIGPVVAGLLNSFAQDEAEQGHRSVSSGFAEIDNILGGLKKGALIVIAARPGMGKTALALNIARQAAFQGQAGTAIFSLEMSKEELATRILSSYLAIDSQKFNEHNIREAEWDKLRQAFSDIYPAPIYIDDRSGTSTLDMLAKCRQLKLEGKLDLVVVDYLQLMAGNGGARESRQQEISDISRQLKVMARELDVPVIALSQLSRSCEARSDKRPVLSDLRDSGAIEQDADVVMFIYRDSVYNNDSAPAETESAELIIAKNRHGQTRKVNIGWLPAYTTFYEYDYSDHLDKLDAPDPTPPPF